MKRMRLLLLIFFIAQSGIILGQPLGSRGVYNKIRNKFHNDVPASGAETSAEVKRTCQTMEMDNWLRSKYPSMGSLDKFEVKFQEQISAYRKSAQPLATVYIIPVVVHVIHNGEPVGTGPNISQAQVQSQIDVLNEDFRKKPGTPGFNSDSVGADVEIEFTLALRDPQGDLLTEPGINRVNGGRSSWNSRDDVENILKPQTQWTPEKYMNIWTLTWGGAMLNTLGYAQFPSLSGLDGINANEGTAITDGVVIVYNAFGRVGTLNPAYNGGRTATHEVGHWLGLRHIWGDELDCQGDDFIDDTPVHAGPNYKCEDINSCPGGGNDMVENYMDYTNDACMNIFTQDQKTRMRTALTTSPRRKELISSDAGVTVSLPIPHFSVSEEMACEGATLTFTDQSKNNPTSWLWRVSDEEGNVLGTFTSQNFSVPFNSIGQYTITLFVSNSGGTDSLQRKNFITILSNTTLALPFLEDFEGTSVLPNWVIYNPEADVQFTFTDEVSANGNGTWAIYFNNYSTTLDLTGTVDALISPELDFSANQNAYLNFDLAYTRYNEEYADTLVLYYSTDCGKTFNEFWRKSGADLATAPDDSSLFIPAADQWRKERISLAFLNGLSSVHLAISNNSGWGNTLYLDNIELLVPTVTQAPVANFTTNTDSICEEGTVHFTDASANYSTSWLWEFTGGIPASSVEQYPFVTYTSPGSYRVKLTAANGVGSNSKEVVNYITVIAKPVIMIAADNKTIEEGDSVTLTASGGMNYIWSDERGMIAVNVNSITVAPDSNTTYRVEGENTTGCMDTTSIIITVTDVTAVTKTSFFNEFVIYPNPGSGIFHIKSDAVNAFSVEVEDLTGRLVYSSGLKAANTASMDLSKLTRGLYIVKFRSENGVGQTKLIVE